MRKMRDLVSELGSINLTLLALILSLPFHHCQSNGETWQLVLLAYKTLALLHIHFLNRSYLSSRLPNVHRPLERIRIESSRQSLLISSWMLGCKWFGFADLKVSDFDYCSLVTFRLTLMKFVSSPSINITIFSEYFSYLG